MSRKIHCDSCGKYVGEIRDAKLAKGLTFNCVLCKKPKRSVFDDELESIRMKREFLKRASGGLDLDNPP